MNQHIISLEAENIKRIKAIRIQPDGSLVVIGGQNGQGKTSTLDAIEWAFGGKPDAPQPIRQGESRARIVAETEDYRVTRTFSAAGSSLKLEGKDGKKFATPQTLLDGLVGDLSFDPLAFSRMKPVDQADALRKLVGLDLSKFDQERQQAYDSRTVVNREAKALQARIAALPVPTKAAGKPESTDAIMAELRAQQETIRANADRRANLAQRINEGKAQAAEMAKMMADLEALEARLTDAKEALAAKRSWVIQEQAAVDGLVDPDVSGLQARLAAAGELAKAQDQAEQRAALQGSLIQLEADAESLTQAIEAAEAGKRDALAAARFPVPGLSFSETGGVAYNGVPFEQASSAEQLRVSVAMGLAMNPGLRVLLIRDGSLLDENNLAAIAAMAAEYDAQVWVERVGAGKEVSVLIEDGQVAR